MLLFFALSFLPVIFCVLVRIQPSLLETTIGKPLVGPGEEEKPQGEIQEVPLQNLPVSIGQKKVTVSALAIFATLNHRFLLGFIVLLGLTCLGSRALGEEREMGTIAMLLLRPVHKGAIYLAQFFALLCCGLLLALPALTLMYILLFWGQGDISVFLKMFYIHFLGILAYSALFLWMGIFQGGIYISLGYTLFWEIMVVSITERARTLTISHYIHSLLTVFFQPESKLAYMAGPDQAIGTLLGIAAGFVFFGWFLFQEKEMNFTA